MPPADPRGFLGVVWLFVGLLEVYICVWCVGVGKQWGSVLCCLWLVVVQCVMLGVR